MVYYQCCKPSANLMQGFSKWETNNFPPSPATRGRELKQPPNPEAGGDRAVARHARA